MSWIEQKIADINNALKEIENSNISDKAKITILNVLKEEVRNLDLQKQKISNDSDFIKNSF